ncbi:MAG: DUF2752 domain-containing protein [Bacteroidota bacterium]
MNWSRKKQKRKILQGNNKNTPVPANERRNYLIINAIFAGIIVIIFIYSGIISPEKNSYPIVCIHEQITGEPCPSCGLSRSFSYIIRGDLDAAERFNEYGIRIFLFFAFHLLMRISNIVYLLRKPLYVRQLAILDSVLAIITFILAFRQFFIYYLKLLF